MIGTNEAPPEPSAPRDDATVSLAQALAEAEETAALAAAARARAARLRRAALTLVDSNADANAMTDDVDNNNDAAVAARTPADAELLDAVLPAGQSVDYSITKTPLAEPKSVTRAARWRRQFPSLSSVWKAAALILICVFCGASGYMMWQHRDATQRAQRAAQIVAGARQGVVSLTSFDFKRAKEGTQQIIDSSTGKFRDEFKQRASDFERMVEQSKEVIEETVNAVAIESMNDHSASVLVSTTSRKTNSAGVKDQPRVWRLLVTVTEDGGQYKMSRVEFLQ
jgi:Mce-associated membrane protein